MSSARIQLVAAAGLALAGTVAAQNNTNVSVSISIPYFLPARPLLPDVYGYSIEPIWLDSYINNSLAANLLGSIAEVAKTPPPIRVGGNTADQTYLHPSLTGFGDGDSVALPNATSADMFNITPQWFDTWEDYFPSGTAIIYTLNFADNESDWANAINQAEAAHAALGDKLVAFELGNEIDHFISKGWRPESWGASEYVSQFRNLTASITGSAWYQALSQNDSQTGSSAPTFQAGVIADPPLVPDQQDEQDDFSIANLTAAGIASSPVERALISSYATHLYPQSACDTERWYRMRLDLLSDHSVLWQNVSQYVPQIAAAEAAGSPLVMGETNSVSCSGRSGISDTFGAALWTVDYVLTAASLGFQKVYFHLGAQSQYSAFTPLSYELDGEMLASGIRANWYAHYFIARVAKDDLAEGGEQTNYRSGHADGLKRMDGLGMVSEQRQEHEQGLWVAALPSANSSSLSGFAVYGASGCDDQRQKEQDSPQFLRKLVFLDMGVWNGTSGLSNPSTLSATDGTMFSPGKRPSSTFQVATPWPQGSPIRVIRLRAPGTNAKSGVMVAGTTFNSSTGSPMVSAAGGVKFGDEIDEVLQVGDWGMVQLDVDRAEGVLLELQVKACDDRDTGNQNGGGDPSGGGSPDGFGSPPPDLSPPQGPSGSPDSGAIAVRTHLRLVAVAWLMGALIVLF